MRTALMVWTYAVALLGGLYTMVGALIVISTGADIDPNAGGRPLATIMRAVMTLAMLGLMWKLGPLWHRLDAWLAAAPGLWGRAARGVVVFFTAPSIIALALLLLVLASIATGENTWESAFGL
jgi:hypothetical protein